MNFFHLTTSNRIATFDHRVPVLKDELTAGAGRSSCDQKNSDDTGSGKVIHFNKLT